MNSSFIIEHLRKSCPRASILYLYHHMRTPRSQTLQMCALVLLCQVLEEVLESTLPTGLLKAFALQHQHGSTDWLPPYELLQPILIQDLSGNDFTYVVVDALDEYHTGDVVAQTELIREMETLNVNILVTSHSHVPFRYGVGNVASCNISATPDDIRAFVNHSMEKSNLGDVLRRSSGMLEEVGETAVLKADGM